MSPDRDSLSAQSWGTGSPNGKRSYGNLEEASSSTLEEGSWGASWGRKYLHQDLKND